MQASRQFRSWLGPWAEREQCSKFVYDELLCIYELRINYGPALLLGSILLCVVLTSMLCRLAGPREGRLFD